MSPEKHKAIGLVDKFTDKLGLHPLGVVAALICVEEIISTLNKIELEESGILMGDLDQLSWLEVKQEIEKL